jgi:hypothetical protein
MVDKSRDLEKAWRTVGWVFAAVALVIVAGPQILALFRG